MKLKHKSIIIIIIIIITSSMPLSMYILSRESDDKISLMKNQGLAYSRILSRLAFNVVLTNGGDLKASSIDASDIMSAVKPLSDSGLIYSDLILVSKNPANDGYILAKYYNDKIIDGKLFNAGKVSYEDVKHSEIRDNIKEVFIPELKDTGYQFVSALSSQGGNTYYAGRLIFANSMVLAPVARLRTVILIAMLGNLLFNLTLAVLLGRAIAKPIESLISEVEIIGSGDIDHRIKIKGKNEISRLATTFNHLAQVLDLEINSLKNKNIELIRVNNLKDDFLANVTHELRTPLYGMIGLAESLMSGIAGGIEEKAKYNLSLMVNSGKRLTSLVNDILDYSQLKHGDITLNLSSINLHSIVKLIISISEPLIGNKDLIIGTSIEPDSFYVSGDENRLQQILLNIIGNAIKFTESGNIEISAEFSPENNDEIIISVRDTGMGIAKEDQQRIFELFEQAGGPISKYKTGTGIGLSISRQLIELHGGKIWVDSEPNKGSCFSFTLKKRVKEAVFTAERASNLISGFTENQIVSLNENQIIPQNIDPENKLARSQIMIVDDEPVNCQVLINHLYMEGYIIIPLSNGRDALAIIDAGQIPDLIILDVMLPIMSGYDVCRKIRERFSPGELPVLMLTAKSSPGDLIIGFEAGTNDYLTKPISKDELLARVNGLLQLKKSVKDRAELNLIKREISIAQNIQKLLLGYKKPDIENISLTLRYFPMYEIGGDFYEITPIDENRIGILIADVSGHGIPAAFISGMLKVICNFHSKSAQNPAEFMQKINDAIYNFVEEQFITACYSVIDLKEMKIIQSNAGHWPMVIFRKTTSELIINFENKMPLGCTLDEKYDNKEYDLKINDRLIFYTDGIIEIKNIENKMFGDRNFFRLIKAIGNYKLEDFADKIIETIKRWRNSPDGTFSDDVTLLAVDIKSF
jgi:two-component system, sensor histidine kinase ChiS